MTVHPADLPPPGRASPGAWAGVAAMALLGSCVAAIWGTQHLPVFAVQAARYGVAAAFIVMLAAVFRIRLVLPRPAELGWVFGGAMFGLIGFNIATIIGTRHAEPAMLGAAVACLPVVLAVAGPMAQRMHPPARVVLGAVVVTVGAIAVTGWGHGDAIGVAMSVALIVCEAAFTLCAAPVLPRIGAWSYSAATAVLAAAVFAAMSAIMERPSPALFATPVVLGAILYLGAVGTAIAFVLWLSGVQRLGAGAVGLCAGVAAPSAALVGTLLGAPLPTFGAWAGMGVIAIGLFIGLAPVSPRGTRRPGTRVPRN